MKGRYLKGLMVFFAALFAWSWRADAAGREFFDLVSEGTLAEVQAAVRAGADLNSKRGEVSLLHAAVDNPDPNVLKFLLGAKRGGWGRDVLGSALYNASNSSYLMLSKPNPAKVRLLLEAGADVEGAGAGAPWTPLFASLFYIYYGNDERVDPEPIDPEVVRLLIEAGANVNVANGVDTPLFWAVSGEDFFKTHNHPKFAEATTKIKEMLLKAGAKGLETMQGKPLSPQERELIRACQQGDLKEALRLIAAGVDVNAVDPIRKTTPILAVAWPYDETEGGTLDFGYEYPAVVPLVRALARAGADLNARNRGGETILHAAVSPTCKTSPVVQTLLEAGADPNIKDVYGKTPLALVRTDMRSLREDLRDPKLDRQYIEQGLAEKARIEKLLLQAGGRE